MKTLEIKKLEFLLIELNEGAKELSNYGNSKEKARGCGMKEVIDQVRDLYKNEYLNVLKLDIDNLLVSYLEGSNYRQILESFTSDDDKIDLILMELRDYAKDYLEEEETENIDHSKLEQIDNQYIDSIVNILFN